MQSLRQQYASRLAAAAGGALNGPAANIAGPPALAVPVWPSESPLPESRTGAYVSPEQELVVPQSGASSAPEKM